MRMFVCVSDYHNILWTSASLWARQESLQTPDGFFKVIANKVKSSRKRELIESSEELGRAA